MLEYPIQVNSKCASFGYLFIDYSIQSFFSSKFSVSLLARKVPLDKTLAPLLSLVYLLKSEAKDDVLDKKKKQTKHIRYYALRKQNSKRSADENARQRN